MQYAIIWMLFLVCCKNRTDQDVLIQNTTSYNYELKSNGKILSYEVDDNTKYNFSALFTYTDNSRQEYLTFKNTLQEILFYDLNNEDFLFKIKLEREGPNGIPGPSGFYIEDFDNIYVTCAMTPFLYKIDTTGAIIQKIRYGQTESGHTVIPFRSWSFDYTPLVFIDSKLYLPQGVSQFHHVSVTPIGVVIDTLHQQSYELPFNYFQVITQDEYDRMSVGDFYDFSRIFNGKKFVYSFFGDENIRVVSVDHQEIQKHKIKSKYINRIVIEKRTFNDMYAHAKYRYGMPLYGNLIHDPYRNLYYRFAYPKIELEDGPDYVGLTALGRKKFSIIILDEEFNVIGETLFPEWTYCPTVLFVHRDGLYICNNHPMNPSFNEDILSFECFEVTKAGR